VFQRQKKWWSSTVLFFHAFLPRGFQHQGAREYPSKTKKIADSPSTSSQQIGDFSGRTVEPLAASDSGLALHQSIHQQHPQLTQLVNRQRHIALFTGQVF
jgi:hypothetical protein